MTLDEAIKHAEEVAEEQNKAAKEWHENQKWCEDCAEEHRKLAEWLKELKQFKEQEPCEDVISKKDTIEWLKKVTVTDGITFKTGFKQILHDIEQMPPVTPRPKMGYWKVVSDGYGDNAYICECSECKDTVWVYKDADKKWNYCPNCGAKMQEVKE